MKKLKNQNGRSMIEMLGVLAIIGVLSVGGIAGYSKAMQKYRINKAIEQITLIAGNVRTFFAPQRNYNGLDCSCGNNGSACHHWDYAADKEAYDGCPVIKKAKIFPDEMLTVNAAGEITSITGAFGEKISIGVYSKAKSGDAQAFAITYFIGSNTEACIELMTYDWASVNVKVIGAPFETEASEGYLKTPVGIETAVEKCSKSSEYGFYYIDFYFDVDVDSDVWKNQF